MAAIDGRGRRRQQEEPERPGRLPSSEQQEGEAGLKFATNRPLEKRHAGEEAPEPGRRTQSERRSMRNSSNRTRPLHRRAAEEAGGGAARPPASANGRRPSRHMRHAAEQGHWILPRRPQGED